MPSASDIGWLGGIYSAAYATGSGGSFVIAGLLAEALRWPSAFLAAGMGAALALPLLLLIGPSPGDSKPIVGRWLPTLVVTLRDREVMRYVIAYAGNTWEVFAIRVWFVPILVYNMAQNASQTLGWNPPVLAGISTIIAVPVSLAVAEIGVRFDRRKTIRVVSVASVLACLIIGWQASGPYLFVLALLMLHGLTSYGNAGAINSGIVAVSRPETRGATLALFGVFGFVSGSLGPLAVGLAIDAAGGPQQPAAWFWGFTVMPLGSVAAAIAVGAERRR